MPSTNPRYASWTKRTAVRKRIKAMGLPCGICGGPIDYSLDWYVDPKDGKRKRHPLSFEVDEIVPISKGGSPTDMANLRPAHRICNQRRGNGDRLRRAERPPEASEPLEWTGDWL